MIKNEQLWTFMEVTSSGGRGVITKWVNNKIEIDAKDEFHDMLNYLRNSTRELWTRPEYSPLDSELGEIRLKSGNLQHRVFGFFISERKQYVMLIGSTKKGREAIQTARERRTDVLRNINITKEYNYGRE